MRVRAHKGKHGKFLSEYRDYSNYRELKHPIRNAH